MVEFNLRIDDADVERVIDTLSEKAGWTTKVDVESGNASKGETIVVTEVANPETKKEAAKRAVINFIRDAVAQRDLAKLESSFISKEITFE